MAEVTEPPLSLRQLTYWLAVVDEGSFTAAARRLAVAQPSLSQQVAALEQRLGAPLIERLSRGVKLTQAGNALLPEARAAVSAVERGVHAVRSARGLEGGVLEIATLTSLAAARLSGSLKRWHDLYPAVTVRMREFLRRTELWESVAAGLGDLGVGTRPDRWRGPIRELGWEEFVIVLPPADTRVQSEGSVGLESLRESEWILYDREQGLSDLVATVCMQAGFRPRRAIETSQVEGAARLAASGLGPALVPRANVPRELRRYSRQLEPPIIWQIVAFTRTAWSTASAAYIDLLWDEDWSERPDGAVDISGSLA